VSIVSYAQNFEDVLLWRVLHDVEQGRYLDIGAQDPVLDSVSLAFYQAGWRGTHIEPTPFYAAKLREARPDETVIEAAVSQSPGPLELHEFPDTGLSTGKSEIAQSHVQAGYEARTILVPTVRLDDLLDRTGEVQWMKIDVEGMEADVLASWGNNPARPWIIIIEATVPNTQVPTDHEWNDLLIQRGYCHVHFDGLSRYFVHESHAELKSQFAAPANVFDQFAVAPHHFSAAVVRAQLEASEQRVLTQAAELLRLNEELLATTQRLQNEQRAQEMALSHAHEKELIEARWRERQAADDELRSAFRETEETLRQALRAADTAATAAQIELARLEERTAQLQDKIARADEASRRVEERLVETQQQLAEVHREIAECRTAVAKTEMARDQAQTDAERVRLQLGAEIERHLATITGADGLIRAAVTETPGRWQRLGERLGLAPRGPAWRDLTGWSLLQADDLHAASTTNQPTTRGPEPIMHSSATIEARNPYHRANSLPELLTWHDVDFVRCAYVTVLGRQPDREGESHYTQQIRVGASKLDVLWNLRRSAEGHRHDPGIAGFDRALKRAAMHRRPILGMIARLFRSDADGNSRRDRALRMLMNTTSVNQRQLGSIDKRLAAIEWTLSRPLEPYSIAPSVTPSLEAGASNPATVPITLDLPELRHLRPTAPLARYFRESAT